MARNIIGQLMPAPSDGETILVEQQDVSLEDRPLWEVIASLGFQIPPEERVGVPHDGGRNYEHYLYGSPKSE